MKRTTNYSLPDWEKSDFIQMSDFNDLTHKLDAALKANADAAAGKADGAAFAAMQEAVATLTAAVGTHGQNARIAFGSYTGDGKYGSANPNSLTFDFKPVMVFIGSDNESYLSGGQMIWPLTLGSAVAGGSVRVTWSGHSVSWYTLETTNPHIYQSNRSGYVYRYVAIGYDE